MYIYIYRAFFGLQFMFVEKYIFDIEQIWVQFPAANSAFWKVFCILSCCPGVLFKKGICPDWTCNSSKDKLTTHECRPFACIIYMLPSKGCLVEKNKTLAGKQHIVHESATETSDIHFKTAVSQPIFEKIMHLEQTYFLQWIVYCIFVNI